MNLKLNSFKNRTTLGIASILLSLIICFALTPIYNGALSAKTEIIRVTKTIHRGEKITSAMIQTVEVGKFNLPATVLKKEENVVGKYATTDFYPDDFILNTKLSDQPIANFTYLNNFDGKERAISVSIKSFAAGLSGKLEAGDIVSVMVSDFGESKETVNPLELRYVQVLAVTTATGADTQDNTVESVSESGGNGNTLEADKDLPATITLKGSPEQAKLLAELEANGKIHLVFVYRGNTENAQKFLDEQNKIILEMEAAGDAAIAETK